MLAGAATTARAASVGVGPVVWHGHSFGTAVAGVRAGAWQTHAAYACRCANGRAAVSRGRGFRARYATGRRTVRPQGNWPQRAVLSAGKLAA